MTDILKQTVRSISESIRFDSSLSRATSAMPFGKGAADCLAHFLSLAQSFGFETHNYDNYVGEVIFGEGEEFAILAHLDVVPAGNGWTKKRRRGKKATNPNRPSDRNEAAPDWPSNDRLEIR